MFDGHQLQRWRVAMGIDEWMAWSYGGGASSSSMFMFIVTSVLDNEPVGTKGLAFAEYCCRAPSPEEKYLGAWFWDELW